MFLLLIREQSFRTSKTLRTKHHSLVSHQRFVYEFGVLGYLANYIDRLYETTHEHLYDKNMRLFYLISN